MYHNFIMHFLVDGHLGWFQILALLNGKAMDEKLFL